jgi:hypothetical protein
VSYLLSGVEGCRRCAIVLVSSGILSYCSWIYEFGYCLLSNSAVMCSKYSWLECWGNAYKVLVGNSEGSRPLERLRRRWEDNIKMGVILILKYILK